MDEEISTPPAGDSLAIKIQHPELTQPSLPAQDSNDISATLPPVSTLLVDKNRPNITNEGSWLDQNSSKRIPTSGLGKAGVSMPTNENDDVAEPFDQTYEQTIEPSSENYDSSSQAEIQSIINRSNEQAQNSNLSSERGSVSAIAPRSCNSEEDSPQQSSVNILDASQDARPSASTEVLHTSRFNATPASSVDAIAGQPLSMSIPPAPDPRSDQPFDFHRFLSQLRHRTADPVAKYLRSFLIEFGKRQWMVHEQTKIISDFLAFIGGKMAQCGIWKGVSPAEFEKAEEGMEKLVMNRLYSLTYSPAIPALGSKETTHRIDGEKGFSRRGQHQEDIERDEILAQKIRIYGWITEQHLDIAPSDKNGQRFLALAQQELLKIKNYRAPRDKVICILNCCKVIVGLLKNSRAVDTSADSFMPLLIYVVLKAKPDNLVSNIQYILRFRNSAKLGGEAGYYLSSLMGAIQFIENLDRTVLTISDDEFERNVEAAVSAIAERDNVEMLPSIDIGNSGGMNTSNPSESQDPGHLYSNSLQHASIPREKIPSDNEPETVPVSSLLRSIQKPLSNIGRIFSEDSGVRALSDRTCEPSVIQSLNSPRSLSPSLFQPPNDLPHQEQNDKQNCQSAVSSLVPSNARSVGSTERSEHETVVETLANMFPNLDRELIDDVVRLKRGRVGSAVDACLALNT